MPLATKSAISFFDLSTQCRGILRAVECLRGCIGMSSRNSMRISPPKIGFSLILSEITSLNSANKASLASSMALCKPSSTFPLFDVTAHMLRTLRLRASKSSEKGQFMAKRRVAFRSLYPMITSSVVSSHIVNLMSLCATPARNCVARRIVPHTRICAPVTLNIGRA